MTEVRHIRADGVEIDTITGKVCKEELSPFDSPEVHHNAKIAAEKAESELSVPHFDEHDDKIDTSAINPKELISRIRMVQKRIGENLTHLDDSQRHSENAYYIGEVYDRLVNFYSLLKQANGYLSTFHDDKIL